MLNSIYEQFVQSKDLKGLTLWLVPTTAIKTQTINALKDRSHPYREILDKKFSPCVVGLITEAERLYDLRKNRLTSIKEDKSTEYINIDTIKNELEDSKKIFKNNRWPTIDVTRKSVEETAASVIKIYEIKNKKNV